MLKQLIEDFFATGKTPCGVFSTTHFIALGICLAILVVLLITTSRCKEKTIRNIFKVLAIVYTLLELFKLHYCFVIKNNAKLYQWFPLAYCSLFIYSIWLSGFGKGKIQKAGDTFLSGAGIIAGICYLIVPSSSLTWFPIFHFLSIHSLSFHMFMAYSGLIMIVKRMCEPKIRNYLYYLCFIAPFFIAATILNITQEDNLMFLHFPIAMPTDLVDKLYDMNPYYYRVAVYAVYLSLHALASLVYLPILKIRGEKKESAEENADSLNVLTQGLLKKKKKSKRS